MARSLVDPVEDWLLRKLREMQLDDWVVEGLCEFCDGDRGQR